MQPVACPLCHSRSYRAVSQVADYTEAHQNVICRGCALVYANPAPTSEELTAYYEKQFIQGRHQIATVEEARERAIRKGSAKKYPIDVFLPFVNASSRVLEIGCSYGFLLKALRDATGCSVQGVEPSKVSGMFAEQEFQIPVLHETVEQYLARPVDQQYDFIILYQVLEHLKDPVHVLRQLKQRLRPDGRLYVCVPDVMHLQEPPESFFQVPHMVSFSPWSFYHTLLFAGLKPVLFNRKLRYPKMGMEAVSVLMESSQDALPAMIFFCGMSVSRVYWSVTIVGGCYQALRMAKKVVSYLIPKRIVERLSIRLRMWVRGLRDGK